MNININLDNNKSYEILIDKLPELSFDKKVLIVTNPKVSGFHIKYLMDRLKAKEIYIVTVPDGENHKNMQTIEFILDRCFEHKLDRKSLLVAFGGGVIGDMTGFAASIYQRGIEFIQIPTTLLSQVDASVGGKTGVNNRFGKNLVGAFHQPNAVYIDTYFLKTLPVRDFVSGIAEIIKMAVMFDKDFFEWLENADLSYDSNVKYAIKRAIELKAEVVSQDEREAGVRAVLNYGHTFAHVVENFTNYEKFFHGEAVSIGMVMANELALALHLIDEVESKKIIALLKKYNLPVSFKVEDAEKFYEAFLLDKKSSDSKIKFILPNSIGSYSIKDSIDKKIILTILEKFS